LVVVELACLINKVCIYVYVSTFVFDGNLLSKTGQNYRKICFPVKRSFHMYIKQCCRTKFTRGGGSLAGRSEGGMGGGLAPATFLELTYSENRVGHSENYGNNSIAKF
jgi:hypothetical protein